MKLQLCLLEQHGLDTNPTVVNLCQLYLIGLDEKQAAVLLNRDYSSIKRYEKKIRDAFETKESFVSFFGGMVVNF